MPLVLIVDDEEPVRNFMAQVLAEGGYETLTASDGHQALGMVGQRRPDLVISDVMMPVLNGVELCRRLKAGPPTSSIPVILMSSAGRRAAEGAAADDFLPKPFDLAAMEGLVNRWLPRNGGTEGART